MSTRTRSYIPQHRRTVTTMGIVCLHIIQRWFTYRFFLGFFLGILLTLFIDPNRFSSHRPQIRTDQSKMEYEKNQFDSSLSDRSSIWNSSWDKVKGRGSYPRHLYLIRHGQYFDNARTMDEMKLTELGREQCRYTGKRLNEMNISFDRIIHSGMVRARESAIIINEQLKNPFKLIEDVKLTEGIPVAPIPYAGISQEYVDAMGDRERIDQAFSRYFRRSARDQPKETHEILVFHANILRYFICKVMQFPVQAWLRMTLNHGSITQITILSDGGVILKSVGDSGFLPSSKVTF